MEVAKSAKWPENKLAVFRLMKNLADLADMCPTMIDAIYKIMLVCMTRNKKIPELGRHEGFCVFASPTRKHFDNVKRENTPQLKTPQSRMT